MHRLRQESPLWLLLRCCDRHCRFQSPLQIVVVFLLALFIGARIFLPTKSDEEGARQAINQRASLQQLRIRTEKYTPRRSKITRASVHVIFMRRGELIVRFGAQNCELTRNQSVFQLVFQRKCYSLHKKQRAEAAFPLTAASQTSQTGTPSRSDEKRAVFLPLGRVFRGGGPSWEGTRGGHNV